MTPSIPPAVARQFFIRNSARFAAGALCIGALLMSGCGSWKKDKGEETGDVDAGDNGEGFGSSKFVERCRMLGESSNGAASGSGGWLFGSDELRQIGKTGSIPASHEEVVACITDYHDQLRKAGIDLIVAPIPQKAIVYSENLGARRSGRLDTYCQQLYGELRSRGVHVVDLVPDLRRQRNSVEGIVYPKTANHLSPKGAELVARAIVEDIKGRAWAQGLEADPNLVATPMQITLLGSLAGYVRDDSIRQSIEPETLAIRAIGRRTVSGVIPAARAGEGRIILITSDHDGLAYGAPGNPSGYDADLRGSLADQLIYEFGVPIDVYSHSTSGSTTARLRLLRASMTKPELLKNTVAVIWAFSANEFTRPGWRRVPLNLELRQSEETIGRDATDS